MGMLFETELIRPERVGSLQELLKDLPPDTAVLSAVGVLRIAVLTDEEIGERRVEISTVA